MRQTKLMKIAESHGDRNGLIPSTIDPLVYMLCELSEAAFGSEFISKLSKDIALSNSGAKKSESLNYIVQEFFQKHLADCFKVSNKKDVADKLRGLPALNDSTYVDYFMMLSTVERQSFRTPLEKSASKFTRILTGYQTESPYQVCENVVDFFKDTQDDENLSKMIKGLCHFVKKVAVKPTLRAAKPGC